MKKVLRKTVSIAMIACLLLAAVPMLASAAADVSNAIVDVDEENSIATISGTAGAAGEEIAIVVIRCTHDYEGDTFCTDCYIDSEDTTNIVYIDQMTATGANGAFSFTVKPGEKGFYTAFVGGATAPAQKAMTFEIPDGITPPSIKYGDLDKNTFIQANDIGMLASYLVGTVVFDREQLLASDLDKNEYIQANDIGLLATSLTGPAPDFGFVEGGKVVRDTQGNVIAQN